ncbi:hypothetical protein KIN20_009852 [Parelaphostrongylus tenuis]|uniref:Uncharacterized protein n=1 Tax=Parelaphostrongylus tenuis TaxID=148309 RepID=A0AAD5MA55_PARTN|nr:hypothetical protein KIN20_009852 [Parelaphostrongylus tenuis]
MEEEILDVLHESWDDSTLLRRDALLAEVAMRLEHITLRFLDTFLYFLSAHMVPQRIFQIVDKTEQRRVLALDLTGVSSRDENLRSDFDQSFMFSLTESTKILLAVGRKNSIEENPEPVFRMLYRRRSPRLVVRHNIEVNFCPVSVMYEENALQGLSTLFSDDPNVFVNRDSLTSNTSILKSENTSSIESHVVMNLHIPNVAVELRRRKWSERRQALLEWEAGDPFACLAVQNVSMNYVAIENYVSKMKLGIGHVDITDLVERTGHPLLTTRGIFPLSKPLSASCPDFSFASISQTNVSSSLPSTSHVKDFASANPSRKISSLTDNKRLCEESEATLIATFVDSRHPQFESKYRKKFSHTLRERSNLAELCFDLALGPRSLSSLWSQLCDIELVMVKPNSSSSRGHAVPWLSRAFVENLFLQNSRTSEGEKLRSSNRIALKTDQKLSWIVEVLK